MKLKEGFVLHEVGGQTLVLSSGKELDLNKMITLNDTGKFLWEQLKKGCELDDMVKSMLSEYDVDEAVARCGAEAFVEKLKINGFLEE